MLRWCVLAIGLFTLMTPSIASATKVLFTCDAECRLTVNGDDHGTLKARGVKKLDLPEGDHLVQVTAVYSEHTVNETIEVKDDGQQVVRLAVAALDAYTRAFEKKHDCAVIETGYVYNEQQQMVPHKLESGTPLRAAERKARAPIVAYRSEHFGKFTVEGKAVWLPVSKAKCP